MKLHGLFVGTVGLLLVSANAPADDAAKDLEKLRGTWLLVSAERDGKKLPEDEVKKTKISFEKDAFVFPDAKEIGTSHKGIIKVYPDKTPKWMDSTDTTETGKDSLSLGLYALDGDDYKVCFAPPGKPRPTTFSSKPGSGHILQVWKRAKE
ncbi:TIGR03067 domain-containing protein [Fimbriiglobus ruber]|uniref:TIGR03067 domain-containing protein n=1 Tax=Fimbriiglobus ruber TaxID=1908690 RepID=A0A225DW46_9BACT|nr:TIGR03067 domain-containing protein [Fimbriiglobus ruber]OWK43784.1 hypothetical protein FRUB_03383 [Fimbriiglobus ruber]